MLYNDSPEQLLNVLNTSEIKCDNFIIDSMSVTLSVKHRDDVSSNLFKIFINDMSSYFQDRIDCACVFLNDQSVNCLIYADDLVLLLLH